MYLLKNNLGKTLMWYNWDFVIRSVIGMMRWVVIVSTTLEKKIGKIQDLFVFLFVESTIALS